MILKKKSLSLKPTMLETMGAIIGLVGGLIMLGDVGTSHNNINNNIIIIIIMHQVSIIQML